MADSKDCAVCRKMMKDKHKFDKFYKIGFWVLLVFCGIITTLFCCKGDLFKKTENITTTEINNNSNVDVANGNNNTINIDNGSYTLS